MSHLFALQEARIRYPGTTFTTTYTAGNHANWTAGKNLRHVENVVDLSNVSHERVPDPTVQTRARARPVGIKALRTGTFSISFFLSSTDASAGSTDEIKTLLHKVYGGLSTPTQDTVALDSTGVHTTSRLYASGIEAMCAPGSAVLCGQRGDAKGDGEVHVVVAEGANYIDLATRTKGTMADGDDIWFSHTIYPDLTAAQEYLEFLLIGADSTSPDQLNCIGCAVSNVTLRNLNLGDGDVGPIVELEVQVADHRWEPSGTKATLATGTPDGADPAMDKGQGGFFISDRGAYLDIARGWLMGGGYVLEPDFKVVRKPGSLGVNGIQGWKKNIGSVKWGFTALLDEGADTGSGTPIPNLTDDFGNGTAKQLIYQWGHAAAACVAVDIQNGFLDELPTRTELEEQAAVMLKGHGHEGATTTELTAADHRIHFFHA
jgi:hypothetical protein